MKRYQMRTMLAGWGTMTALTLAMAVLADAQEATGAKGDSILPETNPAANQSFDKQRGIKVEWMLFDNFEEVVNNSHVILHGKVVEQRTVTQSTRMSLSRFPPCWSTRWFAGWPRSPR